MSRRNLILLLTLVASLFVAPKTSFARKPADVVLIGSSSMGGALGNHLIHEVEQAGYSTYRSYRKSAGLCRPDFFDWWREVRRLPIGEGTRAAIVYLGGNDGQPIRLRRDETFEDGSGLTITRIPFGESGWDERYMGRVTSLVDTMCELGVPKVVWLALADTRRDELQERYIHVRELQRRGVAASRCGVYVDTTGDAEFLGTREERKKRRLRSRDGVHLTRLGAEVVWERVGAHVLHVIDRALAPPPEPVFGATDNENTSSDDS